jgi:hypothetical protein
VLKKLLHASGTGEPVQNLTVSLSFTLDEEKHEYSFKIPKPATNAAFPGLSEDLIEGETLVKLTTAAATAVRACGPLAAAARATPRRGAAVRAGARRHRNPVNGTIGTDVRAGRPRARTRGAQAHAARRWRAEPCPDRACWPAAAAACTQRTPRGARTLLGSPCAARRVTRWRPAMPFERSLMPHTSLRPSPHTTRAGNDQEGAAQESPGSCGSRAEDA